MIAASYLLGSNGMAVRAEPPRMTAAIAPLHLEGELPPLSGAVAWINSPPIRELRGKIVLVEFWTYTCINWRRTLPYMRAWTDKYKDRGLVVIGVHTPEFGFERDLGNVRQFTREFGVNFPVAVDSNYLIWRHFHNQYWPALYLADGQGHIRYHQFGEGNYRETELAIQKMLAEAGYIDIHQGIVSIIARGVEEPADWRNLQTPETYVGYERSSRFSSPEGTVVDRVRAYSNPRTLKLNEWALAGEWSIGREAAVSHERGGRITFRFHARDVNLVMAPPKGASVRFRVFIDGRAPGASHGVDVDEHGDGTLDRPMTYQLIRALPVADHVFQIEFSQPRVAVFDFTFG